jgi:hypothetical protein
MSERKRLSNRRVHEIFDFEAMGLRFTAGIGRIAELFLDHNKAGTAIDTPASL